MSEAHPTATEHFRLGEEYLAASKDGDNTPDEAAAYAAQATAHFAAANTLMTLAIAERGTGQNKALLWQQQWGVFK